MISGLNYVIYGWSSGEQLQRKIIVAVITQDRVIDENLRNQINNQTLHT